MSLGDLVVVVADGTMKAVVETVLARPQALGIREIRGLDVAVLPGRDPQVRIDGPAVAGQYRHTHLHALVMCDHEGSGAPGSPADLQQKLTEQVQAAFGPASAAVVFAPELEEWVVGAVTALAKLGGRPREAVLDHWRQHGFLDGDRKKPPRPKEAVGSWLKAVGERQNSSVYRKIADSGSLGVECQGESWPRFCDLVRTWFPA